MHTFCGPEARQQAMFTGATDAMQACNARRIVKEGRSMVRKCCTQHRCENAAKLQRAARSPARPAARTRHEGRRSGRVAGEKEGSGICAAAACRGSQRSGSSRHTAAQRRCSSPQLLPVAVRAVGSTVRGVGTPRCAAKLPLAFNAAAAALPRRCVPSGTQVRRFTRPGR